MLRIFTLCFLFISTLVLAKNSKKESGKIVIPKEFSSYVPPDYHTKFQRLSSFEKSALHWNQGIVVYCNTCKDVYINNDLEYLREFDDDEDDEDDEEEDSSSKTSKYKKYAVGTVIVKDHFPLEKRYFVNKQAVPTNPTTVAVMIKRKKGFDPIHDDWQYGYFTLQGNIIVNGKGENQAVKKLCSDCHKNIHSRDHIFSSRLKSEFTQK